MSLSFYVRSFAVPVVLGLVPSMTNAAVVTAVSVPSVPLNNVNSVFDASHSGNTYSLGVGTILNPNPIGFQYDARDIFGGTFQTYPPEVGATIFADGQPIHTVESVTLTIPTPTTLASYSLWLGEDGDHTGHRSTQRVRILAGATTLDDVILLNSSGIESFESRYGGSVIRVDGVLPLVAAATTFTIEFVQNQSAGPVSGLRVLEFQAFDRAITPEPATSAMYVAGVSLCALLQPHKRRNCRRM